MRNKLLLYFLIFLLKETKLSHNLNDIDEVGKKIIYAFFNGLKPWLYASAGILIGRVISHIYYDILNPEKSLAIMEERLRDEKYWEKYKDDPEVMKKGKDIIEKDIEKFKKIIAEKAEKKRKKEEAEAQKKQVGENNATNHSSSENKGAFPFFLTKKIIKSQSCDALYSQKAWKYSCSPFLSQSNSVTYPIKSIITSTFTKYNKILLDRQKTSLDEKVQPSFFEYLWSA